MKTEFSGRLIQYVEALDFGDAVSNQILEIDAMLKKMGIRTLICSKWTHEQVAEYRVDLEDVSPTDRDIALIHYAGFSQYVIPHIGGFRCTKILHYHNITPHEFFDRESTLYSFCLDGRKQLAEVLHSFQYCWGDSEFNIKELISLGADPSFCFVVPIIVDPRRHPSVPHDAGRNSGTWMFLGRVAPNKGQVELVELFARVRRENPSAAQRLLLVGGFDKNDPYCRQLQTRIGELELEQAVVVTGKVSDQEVARFLGGASIYVSLSRHEGFGVPLIEATHYGLPVVALRNTAIGETLGDGTGLADTPEELGELALRVMEEREFRALLLEEQLGNSKRFLPTRVYEHFSAAIARVVPRRRQFRTVSIVVCTYNRADHLERCLEYLEFQTNPNFEVVVINGPSTDGTEMVLRRFEGRIKIGRNMLRNLSISRNIGIEMADGDLIAFIDDDAIPFDDWVETLLREFNGRPLTTAGLGGPVYYAGSLEFQSQDIGFNKFAETFPNIESSKIGRDGWERTLLGTNTCFQGEILRRECGFDEQFDYFLDESELCFRLQKRGLLVSYSGDLFLRHEFAQSENRAGKHKFNWHTICKNTAYFIAAYSGLEGAALRQYLETRMRRERIEPLMHARDIGEISEAMAVEYIEDIRSGWNQGLIDYESFPRLRKLTEGPGAFQEFPIRMDRPRVEAELPRLHICIVTKEFAGFSRVSGGIGTLYYHLASELLLMGHRVTVITPDENERVYQRGRFTVRCVVPSSVCVDNIGAPGFVANVNWSLSALNGVAASHLDEPVDIVESALWDSEALTVALLPAGERPFVVTRLVTPYSVAGKMNGWDLSTRDAVLIRRSERTLIEASDFVIPISEAIADTIEVEHSIARSDRWQTSYCGVAHWPFFDFRMDYAAGGIGAIEDQTIPPNQRVVLFIGRLEGRKGIDVLLRAANEFLLAASDTCLILAGRDVEGWRERAKSMLGENVCDRIHFVGEVEDSTRERLLHSAYCVIFPSRYESFGLVPLEAFVHGVPVIGAQVGAVPEVVENEMCGLLFEDGNADALADCVARLVREPRLRERLAEGARKQAKRFSARNAAIETSRIYANLLARSEIFN